MGILAGKAVAEIETPLGMDMTGYIGRMGPSVGVHDTLKIRCLVFESAAGGRVALAVCDLLGLSQETVREIQLGVERVAGIPADTVVVACTHTHSGPASIHLENCGTVDVAWLSRLVALVIRTVVAALRCVGPASLRLVTGRCDMAFNRVAGRSAEEDRRVDTQVSALEVTPLDPGASATVLVDYACHPVTLAEPNQHFSADFPYYAERALRERRGASIDLVYLPGCCGDLDPIHRGGFGAAERTGNALAESILEGSVVLEERAFEGGAVSIETRHVALEMRPGFSPEELAAMVAADGGPAAGTVIEGKVRRARSVYARRMLEATRGGQIAHGVSATMCVLRIGPVTVVTLPFEVFGDIGLEIKKRWGAETTLVVGYAGGDFGYLPSSRLYDRARYEVGEAFLFYGYPGPLERDAERRVYEALNR